MLLHTSFLHLQKTSLHSPQSLKLLVHTLQIHIHPLYLALKAFHYQTYHLQLFIRNFDLLFELIYIHHIGFSPILYFLLTHLQIQLTIFIFIPDPLLHQHLSQNLHKYVLLLKRIVS